MIQLTGRQKIIQGIFITVIVIYLMKLFYIQIINSRYKYSARNNAIRYEVQQAALVLIYDRNGKLLVSNIASYDLMVVPKEVVEFDTLKLCSLAEINIKDFRQILETCKNYSKYKESVFSKPLKISSAHKIQESMNEFNGFYIRVNTTRDYPLKVETMSLALGEVDENRIKEKYYTKVTSRKLN